MRMIKNFIFSVAKRIEDKNRKEREAQEIAKAADAKLYSLYKEQSRKIIEDFIHTIEKEMQKAGCHLKPGDTAVLNYYNLIYDCKNGWDSGPPAILKHVPDDIKVKPLKVKIKEVRISHSLFTDRLDSFLEHFGLEELREGVEKSLILDWFKNFSAGKLWARTQYGLYWEATFEPINFDFKPKWGLNVGSFLINGTKEAKVTKKYWKKENKVKAKLEKAFSKKIEFERELKKLLGHYEKDPTDKEVES